jgi:hypothetical protein
LLAAKARIRVSHDIGQFDDAVAEQDRAIEILRAAARHDEVADFQTRLDLYRRRQPYGE